MTNNAHQQIIQLRNEINRHNYNYYVLNAPIISDKEFDFLLKQLEELEQKHPEYFDPDSPTQRVGSDISNEFEQIKHIRPMMSLSNTYSFDEVTEWYNKIKNSLGNEDFSITGEMKFDGTSISLHYEQGKLIKAVTRGDGEKGDDVTANIRTIKSIPLNLLKGDWPQSFEIRGEILMPWNSFERLNKERDANDEQLFANPRNAASGTLKLKDSKEVARRNLDIRLYYLLGDNLPADNHYDNLVEAKQWGFKIGNEIRRFNSLQEIKDFIEYWDIERKNLPIATDGLVFKVNSIRQQLNLGYTAKSPRWAIAYKFNPENACTKLKYVSFETGRMGIITPVANLEPVQLSGTIVKRASLHNDDIIRQLDIHQNDWVYVEKGGEIIPKITGVEKSKREANAQPIKFVTHCPECGTPLIRVEGEAAWVCPNTFGCRPQITGKIQHFAARKMMNIDGIGEETAELLYSAGLVKTISDIYKLTSEQLEKLERLGHKSAQKIIQSINDSKNIPFERVINALSIPNVGETTAKRLALAVKSMDNLQQMDIQQLTQIPDIGPIVAKSIVDYLDNTINAQNIELLKQAGLQMAITDDKAQPQSDILQGKTIVISGTFTHHSRDQYKEIIEQYGGKNASSISKKTSFVLAGDNMGPAKLEKCHSLGIDIITEDQFLRLIDQSNSQ